jgi:pimeloyl-ACP methyl ester carboxylesterase
MDAMGHVVVDGKRLEVEWFAAPVADRPTIVLLHEGLGSVALWKDFPRQLARRTGWSVVAYSRYGHGNSDPLTQPRRIDFMHHEAEIVLPALLDRLEIARPVLFGHSDGASIALIFAGAFPRRAAALVLEAPHVLVEGRALASISRAREDYFSRDLPTRLAPYHADPESTFRGWNDIWLDPAFRAWNIEEYLSSIRCPVLLIQGQDDEYGTQAQLDAIARRVRDCEVLLLPGCGHSPHREQEAVTLEAAAGFIRRLTRAVP